MSETISAIVWPVLGAVLTALAGVLAPILVKWALGQLEKIHLTVSAERQAQLEYYAKQAILKAAELAAQKAKTGGTLSGADKLQIATLEVMDKAAVTPAEAADTIHAVLPQLGLGAWATKQKADAASEPAKLAVIPFAPKAAGGQ